MRTRIIGVAVLASVLATCLFGGPLAVGALKYLLRKERGHLVRVANDVAISVAADVDDDAPISADDLSELGEDGEYLTAAVFDGGGNRLAGTAADEDGEALAAALDGDIQTGADGDVLVAAAPVTHSDQVIGAVLVTEPRGDVLGEAALIWAAMAVLAIASVTVAWPVGRRQARLAGPPAGGPGGQRPPARGRRLQRVDRRGGVPEIDSVGARSTPPPRAWTTCSPASGRSPPTSPTSCGPRWPGPRSRLEAALERTDAETGTAIAASLVDADRLEALIDELLALAHAGPLPRPAARPRRPARRAVPEWSARRRCTTGTWRSGSIRTLRMHARRPPRSGKSSPCSSTT